MNDFFIARLSRKCANRGWVASRRFAMRVAKTLTEPGNDQESRVFCVCDVWYHLCCVICGALCLDRFLHFGLECRLRRCKKVCPIDGFVRKKQKETSQDHHEKLKGQGAGQGTGRGNRFAGDQAIHREGSGLGCLLGARYEAGDTSIRRLREGARGISPVCAAARVYVTDIHQVFAACGRVNRSVTFFCP